jgi:hypothetical protein
MYFVDPNAEMCLYKIEQERRAQRLELLRLLRTQSQTVSAISRLAQLLATAARRMSGGSSPVAPAPSSLSQHREAASAYTDELAA